MKSFSDKNEIDDVIKRIMLLQSSSMRQWGKMSPHQMLCHLSDSFLMVMGEREAKYVGNFVMTSIGKWFALKAPMQWPHGVKTGEQADQERGGTKPVEFEADRKNLILLIHRFTTHSRDFNFALHPMFGEMSIAEWMRWGYLHCDHHLRQFGV